MAVDTYCYFSFWFNEPLRNKAKFYNWFLNSLRQAGPSFLRLECHSTYIIGISADVVPCSTFINILTRLAVTSQCVSSWTLACVCTIDDRAGVRTVEITLTLQYWLTGVSIRLEHKKVDRASHSKGRYVGVSCGSRDCHYIMQRFKKNNDRQNNTTRSQISLPLV